MAAGLGLVNLVLNYENQDCSTVLAFTHFYVTKAVIADTVAMNKELHPHHKMNLLQAEKYNPKTELPPGLDGVCSSERGGCCGVRQSSFCLEPFSDPDLL